MSDPASGSSVGPWRRSDTFAGSSVGLIIRNWGTNQTLKAYNRSGLQSDKSYIFRFWYLTLLQKQCQIPNRKSDKNEA